MDSESVFDVPIPVIDLIKAYEISTPPFSVRQKINIFVNDIRMMPEMPSNMVLGSLYRPSMYISKYVSGQDIHKQPANFSQGTIFLD